MPFFLQFFLLFSPVGGRLVGGNTRARPMQQCSIFLTNTIKTTPRVP